MIGDKFDVYNQIFKTSINCTEHHSNGQEEKRASSVPLNGLQRHWGNNLYIFGILPQSATINKNIRQEIMQLA